MGLKKFNELVKIDLTKHTQKKPTFYRKDGKLVPTSEEKWLDYIEWAKILELLYENGAESVSWISTMSVDKPNTLVITLCIDGNEKITEYPIIDGNSIINEANQMQLHKAELRGFVKAVAIHTGLGLSLWMKEERQLQEVVTNTIEKNKPKLSDDRIEKAKESIEKGLTTFEKISNQFDLTQEQINKLSGLC